MRELITVPALKCSVCKQPKPLTEFYDSELDTSKRCKTCFRARVDAANKNKGRRSTSLSAAEIAWLAALFRKLPSSELREFVRRPEYTTVASKIMSMGLRNKHSD